MKNLLLYCAILFSSTVFSQGRKSPHDTLVTENFTIIYGRPSIHERVIFGSLVKYGQVWRVGADEATIITFKKLTKFGDVDVSPGTYTLFALVNEKEWTLILNSVLGQWGSFSYEKNKESDIAHVTVPVEVPPSPVEPLTIRAEGDHMVIEWELMRVRVKVKPKD